MPVELLIQSAVREKKVALLRLICGDAVAIAVSSLGSGNLSRCPLWKQMCVAIGATAIG